MPNKEFSPSSPDRSNWPPMPTGEETKVIQEIRQILEEMRKKFIEEILNR